jgi:hypothetical protein
MSPKCTKPECSLPFPQEPTTDLRFRWVSPHTSMLVFFFFFFFFQDRFWYCVPIYGCVWKEIPCLRVFSSYIFIYFSSLWYILRIPTYSFVLHLITLTIFSIRYESSLCSFFCFLLSYSLLQMLFKISQWMLSLCVTKSHIKRMSRKQKQMHLIHTTHFETNL